jgi:hypothetical protein
MRIEVQDQPEHIVHKTHLHNNHSKMNWRCGSRVCKCKALSSKSSPAKEKRNRRYKNDFTGKEITVMVNKYMRRYFHISEN